MGHDAEHQVTPPPPNRSARPCVDARNDGRIDSGEVPCSHADRRCGARARHCHRRAQWLWIWIRKQRRVERREGGNGSCFNRDRPISEQDPVSKRDEPSRDDIDHEVDLRQCAGDADDSRHDQLRWRSVMVGLGPDRIGGGWGIGRDLHGRQTPRKVGEHRFATSPRPVRGEHADRDSLSRASSVVQPHKARPPTDSPFADRRRSPISATVGSGASKQNDKRPRHIESPGPAGPWLARLGLAVVFNLSGRCRPAPGM